ncbi:MAG TPA: hypothetical protein VFS43_45835 [Polyangiaceae bacterium]|nr:hypothetical protein [Polyangiaceae bacterium]
MARGAAGRGAGGATGEGGAGGGAAGGQGPDWSCLGNATWPAAAGPKVVMRMRFVATASVFPPDDLAVDFCHALDLDCETPLVAAVPVAADGSVAVEVDAGVAGYFRAVSPTTLPAFVYFTRPAWSVPADDTTLTAPLPLVTPNELAQLATLNGRTADASRGIFLSVALDCERRRSLGVRLSSPDLDPEATVFYIANTLPRADATETDPVGVAGVLNMPTGARLLEARRASDGALIAKANLYIRPGALTVTDFEPTPVAYEMTSGTTPPGAGR